MGVICSVDAVGSQSIDVAYLEQEKIDSEKIERAQTLVEEGRELAERGLYDEAFPKLLSALLLRVDYLGVYEDEEVATTTKTVRRLQSLRRPTGGSTAVQPGTSLPLSRTGSFGARDSTTTASAQRSKLPDGGGNLRTRNSLGGREFDSYGEQLAALREAEARRASKRPCLTNFGTQDAAAGGAAGALRDAAVVSIDNENSPHHIEQQRIKRRSVNASVQPDPPPRSKPRSSSPHDVDALRRFEEKDGGVPGALGVHTKKTIDSPRPYFHSHISLVNDIGNVLLRMGNLHLSFFYFFQAISILSPVLLAAAKQGKKHSALPSFVDAVIGVVLVYISLAESSSWSRQESFGRSPSSMPSASRGHDADVAENNNSNSAGAAASRSGRAAHSRRDGDENLRQTRASAFDGQDPPAGQAGSTTTRDAGPSRPPRHSTGRSTSKAEDDIANNISFAFRIMMPIEPISYDALGAAGVSAASASEFSASAPPAADGETALTVGEGHVGRSPNTNGPRRFVGGSGNAAAAVAAASMLSTSGTGADDEEREDPNHHMARRSLATSAQLPDKREVARQRALSHAPGGVAEIASEQDLSKYGLDTSASFQTSVAALAHKLQGCHPLAVAHQQLEEAVRVIQVCDSARSVYLIPIMHMQCRVALIFNEKKLALHLMQKCLGLTYWYRHGASDAFALAVYSLGALTRIRHAIKRDDAALRIQRWFYRRCPVDVAAAHFRRLKDEPPLSPLATALLNASGGSGSKNNSHIKPASSDICGLLGAKKGRVRGLVTESANSPQPQDPSGRVTAQRGASVVALSPDESAGLAEPTPVLRFEVDHAAGAEPDTLLTASIGSNSAVVGIPALHPDTDDILPLTRFAADGHDDDDDEDARAKHLTAAKDNVVGVLATMFHAMQRTASLSTMSRSTPHTPSVTERPLSTTMAGPAGGGIALMRKRSTPVLTRNNSTTGPLIPAHDATTTQEKAQPSPSGRREDSVVGKAPLTEERGASVGRGAYRDDDPVAYSCSNNDVVPLEKNVNQPSTSTFCMTPEASSNAADRSGQANSGGRQSSANGVNRGGLSSPEKQQSALPGLSGADGHFSFRSLEAPVLSGRSNEPQNAQVSSLPVANAVGTQHAFDEDSDVEGTAVLA